MVKKLHLERKIHNRLGKLQKTHRVKHYCLTIKASGIAKEDQEFIIDTITLEPGTYTISGLKSDKDKVSLKVVFGANEYFAGLKNDTFKIESATSVQIVLSFAEDTVCVNKTVRPVLVVGEEAGDFYE